MMKNTNNVSFNHKANENIITTRDIQWIYSPPPSVHSKCFLLTEGGVAIVGNWNTGEGLQAWFPLPRTNKRVKNA